MGHRTSQHRGRTLAGWAVATALAAVLSAALGGVAATPAPAQEVGIDLTTSLGRSGGSPVVPDAPVAIGLAVSNASPQRATGVTASLVLPATAHLVAPHDRCTAAGSTVTCAIGPLGAGSGTSFPVPVVFDEVGAVTLTSSATADQPDVDDDSDATLQVVVVDEEADLSVVDDTRPALAGTTHRVELLVANEGPTTAGQVALAGTSPTGTTFVAGSFSIPQGDVDLADERCTVAATTFSCTGIPTIEAGTALQVVYDVVLPATVGARTATISVQGRNDPDPSDDTATLTLDVASPLAELRLDLIAPGARPGGRPSGVTLWTWNVGDAPATDVVARVTVPAGWTIAGPTGTEAGRSCLVAADSRSVACTYATVAADNRRDLDLSVTPPVEGSGSGTVAATVTTPTPEAGTHPNEASATVAHAPTGIDLVAVAASHEPATPRSGTSGRVTWTFRNTTPDRLGTDVTYTVTLPPGVRGTFLQALEDDGGVACDVADDDPTPSCGLTGTAPVGEVELTLFVDYVEAGTFPLTATVTQGSTEQAPGDEALTHTVVVDPTRADLRVAATTSAAEVTVGETYTSVVTVRNDGPHDATGVVVGDVVPAGTEVVAAARGWAGVACPAAADRYDCPLGTVPPGATRIVTVTLRATAAGAATTSPSAAAAEDDPDPGSNTAPLTVVAVPDGSPASADVVLTLLAAPEPLVVGQERTDVYLVENRGPRAVSAVAVDLAVGGTAPATLGAVRFGWFGRPCAATAAGACTIPTIPAGGLSFVTVAVTPTGTGVLEVEATATAAPADPDPASNVATATRTVVAAL